MWEEFDEAMQNDVQLASKRLLQIVQLLRKGKRGFGRTVLSQGREKLTQLGKEHFKKLPT